MSKDLEDARQEITNLRSRVIQLEGRDLPWAAKDGFWNGDMLYDWIRNNMETTVELDVNGTKVPFDLAPYLTKPIMKWKQDDSTD